MEVNKSLKQITHLNKGAMTKMQKNEKQSMQPNTNTHIYTQIELEKDDRIKKDIAKESIKYSEKKGQIQNQRDLKVEERIERD
jgi:hypothetical protein